MAIVARSRLEKSRSPTPRRNPKGELLPPEPHLPSLDRDRYSPAISFYRPVLSFLPVPDSTVYDARVHARKHPGPAARPLCNVMRVNRSGTLGPNTSTHGSLVFGSAPFGSPSSTRDVTRYTSLDMQIRGNLGDRAISGSYERDSYSLSYLNPSEIALLGCHCFRGEILFWSSVSKGSFE